MFISLIFAWLAVLFSLLAAAKWIARKTGIKSLNRFFHQIHIPFGILALACGLIHGFFAGNLPNATLSDMAFAPELFTLNAGTACLVCLCLLGLSYMLRKHLPVKWMPVHRILTIILLALIAIHLIDMGIQLPTRIHDALTASGEADVASTVISAAEPDTEIESALTLQDSPSPAVSPTASQPPEQQEEKLIADSEADAEEASIELPEEPIPSEEAPLISDSEQELATEAETGADAQPASPVEFSGAVLADGIYQGSAEGFKDTIEVSVTVGGGVVTDITIDSQNDTPRFFDYALQIIDDILGYQSLEVDTVSGATFSSAGILNAVYDALSGAVVSGTLQVTQVDLSQVHRKH